jgi:predicted GIY-YIG superfamily endonuclease
MNQSLWYGVKRNKRLLSMISQIMNKPGVYLFKDEAGKVLYVGKAKSFKNRLKGHNHLPVEVYEKHVTTEYREEFDDEKRDSLEKRLILKHNPPFNQMYNTVFCKFNEVPETILIQGRTLYKCPYPIRCHPYEKVGKREIMDNMSESMFRTYALRRIPISFRNTTDGGCYVYTSEEGVKILEKLMLNRWRWTLTTCLIKDVPWGCAWEPNCEQDKIDHYIHESIMNSIRGLITEEFDEINPIDPWAIPRRSINKPSE